MAKIMNIPNIIIDFDSTLVKVEALDELANISLNGDAEKLQKMKQVVDITNQGMSGALTFNQSLDKRLRLFKSDKNMIINLTAILLESLSSSIYKYRDFFLKNRNTIYIVSGGFREYIEPVALSLGLKKENILANDFVYDFNENVVGINTNSRLIKKNGKVKAIKSLNLTGKTLMIGDGMTDYEVRKYGLADSFIAYCENVKRDPVMKLADCVAYSFDDVIKFLHNKF